MSKESLDSVDFEILAHVKELFDEIDPPPEHLVDTIMFNLTLEGLEAEVASLQRAEPVTIRSDTRPTQSIDTMTFSGRRMSLMISVRSEATGGTVDIDGWVTGGAVRVDLVNDDVRYEATSDPNGRLTWTGINHGSIYFVVYPLSDDEPATITPHIQL